MSAQPTSGAVRAATIIQTKLNATLRRAGFITSDPAKTIPGPAEIRARAMIAEDIDREAVKPATAELLEAAHLSIRNEWIHASLAECAARERDNARASVEYIRINRDEAASLRDELKSNIRKIRAAIASFTGDSRQHEARP